MTVAVARCCLLFVIALACLSIAVPALANLGARPAYLYVNLDEGRPSGTFTVTNLSNEKQTYRARATHFVVKENGSIFPTKPDDYSLAEWIKFNPKEFTLPAKSSRKIRFTILPDNKLKPREYWGAIQFMPLTGRSYRQKTEQGHDLGFQVVTALLIPIYGRVPDIQYGGNIDQVGGSISAENINLHAMIHNTGHGGLRLRGQWEVLDGQNGEVVFSQKIKPFLVFPEQQRKLTLSTKDKGLADGDYSVRVRLQQNQPEVILSAQGRVGANKRLGQASTEK